MNIFLLHTHSIMSFIMVLVKFGMFMFIFPLRRQVPIGRLMSVYYLSLALWQLDQAFRFSLLPVAIGTLPYKFITAFGFSVVFVTVEVTYLQFLYRFLYSPFNRERNFMLWATIALGVGVVGFNVWNEFFNYSNVTLMQASALLFGLVVNLWALVLCLRKAAYRRRQDRQMAMAFYILAGVNIGFVLTSVVAVVFGFYSPIGYWTYFITVWAGNLIQVVIYITYSAVPTSFQVKISGFSFVTIVTFLTVVTLVYFPPVMPDDLVARQAQQDGLLKMLVIIIGAALFVILVLPRILRQSLTIPLQRLLAGVQQVNQGDLTARVQVGQPDEIGVLTQNFNQMTLSLKEAQTELTHYAENLEIIVAERTAEVVAQKEEIEAQRDNLEHLLTELKATQQQLIQKEKMASLGELTAGIAHEIQNPLNFVNNLSDVSVELLEELREEINKRADGRPETDNEPEESILTSLRNSLERINHHGKRADNIVKGMLQHSRTSSGEKQPTDLNALVDEYLRLAYHGIRAKDKEFTAELRLNLEASLPRVNLVQQDMGRVLLNLYNNAFYAVQQKQHQTGNAQEVDLSEISAYRPQIDVTTRINNGKVELRVKDNGTGIAPDILGKIYQPFFTTKPTGEGTGLGLSLTYDIITKGHGGELLVESEPGAFTEFIVRVPTGAQS